MDIMVPGLKTKLNIVPPAAPPPIIPETAANAAFQAEMNALKARLTPPRLLVTLDVQGFLNDLATQLANTEGFQIHINYPNASAAGSFLRDSRSGGFAVDPADAPSARWTTGTVMHVASVSKLITAMAMTRALRDLIIPSDTPISGYLPPFWAQGPNIGSITFANLLTHTSGIDSGGKTDFASMQALIQQGVPAGSVGQYHYDNMNFSLCRILLSTLMMLVVTYQTIPTPVAPANQTSSHPAVPLPGNFRPVPILRKRVVTFEDAWPADDASRDLFSIQTYETYVVENVLTSGETARLIHAQGDALGYANPKPPDNGWNSGDISTSAGAAGWHFSTSDLLQVMGDFRRGGEILTTAQAQAMLDDSFGIDVVQTTNAGTIYGKNGFWGSAESQVEQSTVFFLPNQTELVVLVNSSIVGNDTFLLGMIEPTYAAHLIL